MLAIIVLLCAAPVFGGYLHGIPSSVGVPAPLSIAVPVPGPVVVQDNVAIAAAYSASPVYPYTAAVAYSAPQPAAQLPKYASTYAAPNPVIKYSLGTPVTTTTTTYSGLPTSSSYFPHRFPLYHLSSLNAPSFRLQASPLPSSFYTASPQLSYTSPFVW